MTSGTYIDFCFIRKESGGFAVEIEELLRNTFGKKRLNWHLEEKTVDGTEMVVAEVKGMSDWKSEEEAISYIENHAEEKFWDYIQGYKMFIYPVKEGVIAVPLNNIDELDRFAGSNAEIRIYDEQGGDQAATVNKFIKKVQFCPDHTHVRFYFDQIYFLAVPINCSITETDSQWSAFDQVSGLTYIIKKDQVD